MFKNEIFLIQNGGFQEKYKISFSLASKKPKYGHCEEAQ